MQTAQILIIVCGLLALVYGLITARQVLAADAGTPRMQEISAAVQEGARAYLNRQYTTIAMVGVVILIILGVILGIHVAIGFIIGAVLSGAAGYHRHERLGPRQRAHRRGLAPRPGRRPRHRLQGRRHHRHAGGRPRAAGRRRLLLHPARSLRCRHHRATNCAGVLEAMVALGFGGSLISIFARLGGGIFTKGADVGADLVGKVEAGIPEDDPRNPAVIADNVGDNVGDCAGMAADLFETYAVTIVATMLLAAISFTGAVRDHLLMLPLGIGAICILTSIVGTYFVKLGPDNGIMKALYRGLLVTGGAVGGRRRHHHRLVRRLQHAAAHDRRQHRERLRSVRLRAGRPGGDRAPSCGSPNTTPRPNTARCGRSRKARPPATAPT